MTSVVVLKPRYYVDECLAEIRQCLEASWTGMGFKTDEFEKAFAEHTNEKHAYFVASATAGLQLALKVLKEQRGWAEGDEVISTPLTFVSTNHAILYEGLKPVFADIDDSLCMDPASIRACITSKTRAILFVGIGGNPGKLLEVARIAKEKNLALILDGAHMAGTKINGKPVGTEHGPDSVVYSFHSVKNLPTADGGMVCFKEAVHDQEVRKYGWLGIDRTTFQRSAAGKYSWKYDVQYVGLKAHGNSVMAAIGLVQLRHLEADNDRRRAMAALYDQLLKGLDEVKRIPVPPETVSSRHLYQVRVPATKRDKLIDALRERNIHVGMHYMLNTRYPMYADAWGSCPRAEAAESELITLPLHLHLTDEDIGFVARSLAECLPRT